MVMTVEGKCRPAAAALEASDGAVEGDQIARSRVNYKERETALLGVLLEVAAGLGDAVNLEIGVGKQSDPETFDSQETTSEETSVATEDTFVATWISALALKARLKVRRRAEFSRRRIVEKMRSRKTGGAFQSLEIGRWTVLERSR